MEFNDYQQSAEKSASYPDIGARFVYPALGLAGEAGEVVEKVKKIFRNFNGEITKEWRESIKSELGDVLWYVAMLSRDFGFELEEVAQTNLEKLASRVERDVINSDGDDR